MSYDIDLYATIDTGHADGPMTITIAEVGNYTSNVSGMWADAIGHRLFELNGRTAGDALEQLTEAVARMRATPDHYRAMEPANGWGNYDGALQYLDRLRDACESHPKTTIRISA
ncbi:MAG: hypothetical protein HOV73_01750 [Streptomyces sp.]|nr:hypothetical protein [Streptomyces sp.]